MNERDEKVAPVIGSQVISLWCVSVSLPAVMFVSGLTFFCTAVRFNRFTQGIYLTLPFTLSVFMVRAFEGTLASEEAVGSKTGFLVSLQCKL